MPPSTTFIVIFVLFSTSSGQNQQENPFFVFDISSSPWHPTQNRVLTSPNSIFAAGFRPSPADSYRYFFAIWYKNISFQPNFILWSATANSPITNSSALSISSSGVLSLADNNSGNKNLWPQTAIAPPNISQQQFVLNNDGNLVYGNWSSFAFPTNTIVPNQQINGTTLVSNNRKYMFRNSSSLVFNSSSVYWSIPLQMLVLNSNGGLIKSDGTQFVPKDFNASSSRRLSLDDDGNLRVYSFNFESNMWDTVWEAIQEPCTIYGTCNPNYICMSNGADSVSCICPPGFIEIDSVANRESKTCNPKTPILNPTDAGFLQLSFVNFSGGSNQTNRKSPNFATCQSDCLQNPRCLGFGYKFNGKNYCVHQIDRLLYGHWSPGIEAVMFLKVSKFVSDQPNLFTDTTSKLETTCPPRITLPLPLDESNATTRNIAIICVVFAIELVAGVLAFSAFLNKYAKYRHMAQTLGHEFITAGFGVGGPRRFTYEELKRATKNFTNVVGHGGFGIVYKGELPDQRVIAVKRLKAVGSGETEFWAEVTIIARMHHLNLVQMWGFCNEKSQKMLVYEYVSNGSLDKFLFSSTHECSSNASNVLPVPILLDWDIRYRIAIGVARAIAYLHEECLEWVLHCDIKPENILLENDFCPKVSDFGLAKLAKKEDIVSMSRIRGTRGYMAPEWARAGPITAKADVYSFGMVLLEMVSGRRNSEFRESSKESAEWYFPRWAYEKAVEERKVNEILDSRIMECYDECVHFEMLDRMLKTAMWCLQDRPEMRPSMGKVAKMLEGAVEIPEPGKPTIFYLRTQDHEDQT